MVRKAQQGRVAGNWWPRPGERVWCFSQPTLACTYCSCSHRHLMAMLCIKRGCVRTLNMLGIISSRPWEQEKPVTRDPEARAPWMAPGQVGAQPQSMRIYTSANDTR